MTDLVREAKSPSVKLSSRYLFTDDAIVDAMQLIAALTQLGCTDRVKDSIGGIMRAKRALATEKWTRSAEADFWTFFGRLAQTAREVGILNGPVAEPVQASGFFPWLRKLVTFPGAIVVAVSLMLMGGWLWAKTLAETIDGERSLLRGCLVPGSEQAAVADVFADPPKPGVAEVRFDNPTKLAGCAHILAALENKLGKAQFVASAFYVLPNDGNGRKFVNAQCAPDGGAGSGANQIACLWMFAYNAPAADALGKIVQAFAIFILPPLLGALGAWSHAMRQMIRSASTDMARSRLGDRRHWLNMMFGAMLGSAFALWTADKTGVPQMFASLPPLIAAFLAGYGRDFIFAWMDELLDRARGQRGGSAAPQAGEPAPERAEAQVSEPRIKPATRAVGAD